MDDNLMLHIFMFKIMWFMVNEKKRTRDTNLINPENNVLFFDVQSEFDLILKILTTTKNKVNRQNVFWFNFLDKQYILKMFLMVITINNPLKLIWRAVMEHCIIALLKGLQWWSILIFQHRLFFTISILISRSYFKKLL